MRWQKMRSEMRRVVRGRCLRDLAELVLDEGDVTVRVHPALRREKLARDVGSVREQAPRRVIVLLGVLPHHRLAQPVPLAVGGAVLKGGVDGVRLPAQPLRELRDEVVVAAAEEREGQHAADHLALVRPEEARVGEALALARLPLVAREPVELALVPPRLRLLADHLALGLGFGLGFGLGLGLGSGCGCGLGSG